MLSTFFCWSVGGWILARLLLRFVSVSCVRDKAVGVLVSWPVVSFALLCTLPFSSTKLMLSSSSWGRLILDRPSFAVWPTDWPRWSSWLAHVDAVFSCWWVYNSVALRQFWTLSRLIDGAKDYLFFGVSALFVSSGSACAVLCLSYTEDNFSKGVSQLIAYSSVCRWSEHSVFVSNRIRSY